MAKRTLTDVFILFFLSSDAASFLQWLLSVHCLLNLQRSHFWVASEMLECWVAGVGVFWGLLRCSPLPPSLPLGYGECHGRVTIPVVVKLLEKVFVYLRYHSSFYWHDCSTLPFLARTGTGPNTHAEFELAPLLVRALLYFDAFSLGGLF